MVSKYLNFSVPPEQDTANSGPVVWNFNKDLHLGQRRAEELTFENPWDAVLDYMDKYMDGTHEQRKLETLEPDMKTDEDARSMGSRRHLQGSVMKGTMKDCLFTVSDKYAKKCFVRQIFFFSLKPLTPFAEPSIG